MRNLIGVMTAATLLAGCTAYTSFDPLETTGAFLTSEGTLTLKATFMPGGYTASETTLGYHTTALVPALTSEQVDHLQIRLFSVEGESETPLEDANGSALVKTMTVAEAEAGLAIPRLAFGKSYRVKATAYKASETTESHAISAEVVEDFKLDKLKSSAELKIPLMDMPFSGRATASGIIVTPGDLLHSGPVGMN